MNTHIIEVDAIFDMENYGQSHAGIKLPRVLKLIDHALALDRAADQWQHDWCIFSRTEGGGLKCHLSSSPDGWLGLTSQFLFQDKQTWIVGGVGDDGKKYPTAIFGLRHISIAAEYFIGQVTQGRAKLDWSLYLEEQA
jgi:hypothetical protein